jgi:dihydroorotase
MTTLTITRPDDWHLHLRDGDALKAVLPHTARQFARAIIMPNLKPPVTTAEQAGAYRERILAALPAGMTFEPLMTLYATDRMTPETIDAAAASGFVKAVKYYPAGATTNSDSGVTKMENVFPALERMQALGLPLLLHGEVTDSHVDIFDREHEFIERLLKPLVERFPKLRVVLEHITTAQAAKFVEQASENVAATITAHHLLYNRNEIFKGGLRPHFYCLPVLKREPHRLELMRVATSGSKKFFLGTDSAPHPLDNKEACLCAAGCYTAFHAIELYAMAFESADALDKLEAFASFNGPEFYRLPRNSGTMKLAKRDQKVPDGFPFPGRGLAPLLAGETIGWSVDYV